SLGFVSKSND
ncbi:hypothetical protein CP061683_1363B, partial [Chlamydia psittaci 06-1683]